MLIKEGYKYEDLVQPAGSSQIIRSKAKEWSLGNTIAYQMLQVTLEFRDKPSLMLIST